MSEHLIQQRILLAHGSGDTRLWRNNVGTGWAGQATRVSDGNLRALAASLRPGDVVIRGGRPLHAGLCLSSSDTIGITPVTVTKAMIGQRHGLFTAIEVKLPAGSRDWKRMEGQADFIRTIRTRGGLAGFARSIEESGEIMAGGRGWEPRDWQFPAPVIV